MRYLFRRRPSCALIQWGLLGLCLGVAGEAAAQQHSPPVVLGLKFGVNLSTFVGEGCAGLPFGWAGGAAVGLVAARPLSARSALQAEALFSQKGIRQRHYQHVYQDPALGTTASTYQAELQYLAVPLLYAWGPGSTTQTGLFVAAGPQLSIALTKREFVHPSDEAPGGAHEETLATDYHSLVPVGAGYVLGAGYRWAAGKAAGICVELRYTGDVTRVYRAGYGAGSLCPGGSNQFGNGVLQLQVSCLFSRKEQSESVPAPPPAESQPPVWPPRPISLPVPWPVPPPAPPHPDPRGREPRRPQPRSRGERPPVPMPSQAPTVAPAAVP